MKFGIYRIIGNELWPRDKIGSRLTIVNNILALEPDFINCEKIWILNQIIDLEFKGKLKQLLNYKKHFLIDLPFKEKTYFEMRKNNRLKYLLSVNKARNLGIAEGKFKYEYSIILDGDCFFNLIQWQSFIESLDIIEKSKMYVDTISFPVKRLILKKNELKLVNNKKEEPQLAFHSLSNWKFDENILYGFRDKVDLLTRLGFERGNNFSNYYYPKFHDTYELGDVSHISNSNICFEKYSTLRKLVRWVSIALLFLKVVFKPEYYTQKLSKLPSILLTVI